jgi:hypothetical protein
MNTRENVGMIKPGATSSKPANATNVMAGTAPCNRFVRSRQNRGRAPPG